MRYDLNKQLCEHERYSSSNKYGTVRNMRQFSNVSNILDTDNEHWMPSGSNQYRESMKKRFQTLGTEKEFGENLNPLFGLIEKYVGKRWDDFYSDLSKAFNMRSVINQHILLHLHGMICVKTYVNDDNKIVGIDNRTGEPKLIEARFGWDYFVDPTTNIICKNKNRLSYKQYRKQLDAAEKATAEKTHRKISNNVELIKINGAWFEVKFLHVDDAEYHSHRLITIRDRPQLWLYDVLKKQVVCSNRIAISKRTLSRKELQSHNLV